MCKKTKRERAMKNGVQGYTCLLVKRKNKSFRLEFIRILVITETMTVDVQ